MFWSDIELQTASLERAAQVEEQGFRERSELLDNIRCSRPSLRQRGRTLARCLGLEFDALKVVTADRAEAEKTEAVVTAYIRSISH